MPTRCYGLRPQTEARAERMTSPTKNQGIRSAASAVGTRCRSAERVSQRPAPVGLLLTPGHLPPHQKRSATNRQSQLRPRSRPVHRLPNGKAQTSVPHSLTHPSLLRFLKVSHSAGRQGGSSPKLLFTILRFDVDVVSLS